MNEQWALPAAAQIASLRVEHRNYCLTMQSALNALFIAQPGEIVVIVGPSRVGKSRAIAQAVAQCIRPREQSLHKPYIQVEAKNASTLGSFSTKAFMQIICRALEHPIYGISAPDDPWGTRLHARLHRTSEAMLRDAVEQAIALLGIRYVVIDEAHHVGYAGSNGASALAVLDSWKCMAQRTQTVLVLIGSYQLLDILACAPHLLGRQRVIEFPRYRAGDAEDIKAFTQILSTWNPILRFADPKANLHSWRRLLFTHSFGCIGHLSKWLRSSLGEVAAKDLDGLSEALLRTTRHPRAQEAAIAAEIQAGERAMSQHDDSVAAATTGSKRASTQKPFQRSTKRFPIGGRS